MALENRINGHLPYNYADLCWYLVQLYQKNQNCASAMRLRSAGAYVAQRGAGFVKGRHLAWMGVGT